MSTLRIVYRSVSLICLLWQNSLHENIAPAQIMHKWWNFKLFNNAETSADVVVHYYYCYYLQFI
jgi:hypothetical protein